MKAIRNFTRTDWALVIVTILLVASGVGNVYFLATSGFFTPPAREQVLVYGTAGGIPDLDPHYAYDSASIDVINQVCEGLMKPNLSDPQFSPVPNLAKEYSISADGKTYNFTLEEGVTFHKHQGIVYPFNASVVKWNFDRLNHFLNWSEQPNITAPGYVAPNSWLPAPFNESLESDVPRTQLHGLYETPEGRPLINKTTVISEYIVQVTLNEKKGPFLAILAFSGSYMLSPDATPVDEYMTNAEHRLVGTGPFVFDSFTPDVDIRFARNDNYWNGPPKLEEMVWQQIEDGNTRNQALLSGEIDLLSAPLPSFLSQFEADPSVVVLKEGTTTITQYMMFDCVFMNLTFRKAMSYAFDYDYHIDETMEGEAQRLKSPIPPGVPYANNSKNAPIYNLTYARQVLIDAGIAPASAATWTDAQWVARATPGSGSYAPFASYNYTYNIENEVRAGIGQQLESDLADIGIEVELVTAATWGDVIYDQIFNPQNLQLYPMGWIPDYNDPENYITPFFSNVSAINGMRYYEPDVEALIREGAKETDPNVRVGIYDELQELMVERDYPCLWLNVPNNNDALRTNVKGWVPNNIAFLDFTDVYLA